MTEATKDKRPKGARYGEAFFCLFYLLFMVGMIIIMKIRYDAVYTVGQVDFNDPGRMDAHRFTFGIMLAFLLVFGDCFHLIPRIVYDFKGKLKKKDFMFGIGSLVSSITMTFFYNILIGFADSMEYRGLEYNMFIEKGILALTIIRVVILLLPWNRWFSSEPNVKWAVIRNIPFVLIGILTVCGLINVIRHARIYPVGFYKTMIVCIILSFLFYLPVAILGKKYPKLGMLMVPKTICYMVLIYAICFY